MISICLLRCYIKNEIIEIDEAYINIDIRVYEKMSRRLRRHRFIEKDVIEEMFLSSPFDKTYSYMCSNPLSFENAFSFINIANL